MKNDWENNSSSTIATSLALSALPDDFATSLAGTVWDLNTYFIFIFAVLFVEKLLVIEGIKSGKSEDILWENS